jgi:nitroreductase
MEEEIVKGSAWAAYLEGAVRGARETGKDIVLRDAPHLIVALCDKSFPGGPNNAHFSLAYAELFAPSVGVGTCWAGFFLLAAFSGYTALFDILNLPEGKTVAGALMAGYPRHKHRRLVDRNPLNVQWR